VTRAGKLRDRVAINALGATPEQGRKHYRGTETYARDDVRDSCLPSCAGGLGCEHGNKGYQPEPT
jgi:hypothetical protein